jgi:hypothetical protein
VFDFIHISCRVCSTNLPAFKELLKRNGIDVMRSSYLKQSFFAVQPELSARDSPLQFVWSTAQQYRTTTPPTSNHYVNSSLTHHCNSSGLLTATMLHSVKRLSLLDSILERSDFDLCGIALCVYRYVGLNWLEFKT